MRPGVVATGASVVMLLQDVRSINEYETVRHILLAGYAGLCFFLLRPALRSRPGLAVIAAVLFSGVAFGLIHDRTPENFLLTGLLYGVPFAAVFARRDWERAVGAHYTVDMIPMVIVFLETKCVPTCAAPDAASQPGFRGIPSNEAWKISIREGEG